MVANSRRPTAFLALVAAAAVLIGACAAGWPAPDTRPLPSEKQVRAAIEGILARPEYREPPLTVVERALAALGRAVVAVLRWLVKPLTWLVDRIARATPDMPPSTRWLVVGVLTFVLVMLLLHIFYLLAGSFAHGRRHSPGTAGIPSARSDPSALVERAARLAASGNCRQAIATLYLAALLQLDRAGLVAFDPSRTNWDYLAAVEGHRDLAAAFRRLTAIADRAMYSAAPVSPDDFAAARRLFRAVEVAVS